MTPITDLGAEEAPTGLTSSSTLEASKPANEHFSTVSQSSEVYDVELAMPEGDPLGFSYERWQEGEADVDAGRVRSFADVMNALRARLRGNRG